MDYYDEVVEIKNKQQLSTRSNETINSNADNDGPKNNEKLEEISRPPTKQHLNATSVRKPQPRAEGITSESESDTESEDNAKHVAEGFDYKQWEKLEVPSDIKELFQYISRYSAPKIDISYTLQPFIPDFIPAVGDIDAFLKVNAPQSFNEKSKIPQFIEKLGLEILDEPCGEQSEPALLHMKLRSISTTNPHAPGPPPSVSKSTKDVEKWIAEVQALRANQPYPMVVHSKNCPDIDTLMTEWPAKMEQSLNTIGFPNANLNCSLKFYIELICGLFDIPMALANDQTDYILSLNTLFNLYLAVKNPVE